MKHLRLLLCLLVLPLLGAARQEQVLSHASFVPTAGEREFSGRMIVRPLQRTALLARGMSAVEADLTIEFARDEMARYEVIRYVPQTDEYIIHVPTTTDENSLSDRLLSFGAFQYAEPDWILYPIGCPNDSLFGTQWHHATNIMQSCAGWDLHTGNPSVSVGICDTGIRTTHQDFQLHRLEGYNAVDRVWESAGGNIGPVHPHGTQTTGCAAANGNNGVGVSGVGWNLSHRMLRVSNSSGGGAFMSDLQHAAQTSVESGDRVASVSYSGVDSSSNLTSATYIKSIGGLLVWAAGNDGRNLTFGNRDADDIIVAGATTSSDSRAWFSAYGQFVDVVAPGDSVYTTDSGNDSDYAFVSGTSFSCPITAGLCALIWSADPSLSPDDVELILKTSCDDLGSTGTDNTFGYGRLNTNTAMMLAAGGGGTPPTAGFSGAPTSGTVPLTVSFTDESTDGPTSWAWTFGDGGTSSAQDPTYVYNAVGTYTVSLTVSNTDGSDSLTRTNYIVVDPDVDPPPTANFTGTPTSGAAPLTVNFTDLSTDAPTAWSWTFGDGGTSTAQNPAYVYNADGTYTVSLTVSNASGSDTMTRSGYIVVDSGGGWVGEGYIISKNADFSTDDRTFTRSDTLYILVWSDQVDFNNLRRAQYQIRSGGSRVNGNLTNNGDGSYTATYDLSQLPSSSTSWTFRQRVLDNGGTKYQTSTRITVNP